MLLTDFVRTGHRLTVDDFTHLNGPPFVHGHFNIGLRIDKHPRPVHFLVGHGAPSSPSTRLAEAEMVTLHRHLDVIHTADCNAAAIGDAPTVTEPNDYKTAKSLLTEPAEELAAAGFHDIGLIREDDTPTVGHADNTLAYRCDRISTTLPTERITGYGVELGGDDLSNHRPVWAELTIGHESRNERDGEA